MFSAFEIEEYLLINTLTLLSNRLKLIIHWQHWAKNIAIIPFHQLKNTSSSVTCISLFSNPNICDLNITIIVNHTINCKHLQQPSAHMEDGWGWHAWEGRASTPVCSSPLEHHPYRICKKHMLRNSFIVWAPLPPLSTRLWGPWNMNRQVRM